MTNLGSSNTPIIGDNLTTTVAEIDNTDSPYTTSGENQIEVDTSGGAVTVTIASADIPAAGEPARGLTIINTSTNDLTIETEGAEQIQPDGVGSLTVSADNAYVETKLVAGAVYTDRSKALSALSTESLVIGGTLYEEDDNSPIDQSASDVTYNVVGDYSQVLVIFENDQIPAGHNQILINGETGSNYSRTLNDDTEDTGQSSIGLVGRLRSVSHTVFVDIDSQDAIGVNIKNARSGAGRVVYAEVSNATGDGITQFTLSDSGDNSRTAKARVYGRVMDL